MNLTPRTSSRNAEKVRIGGMVQLAVRVKLAPRVSHGEPANGRRACFRPDPQQTTCSGRLPSPPLGYASVCER